MKSAEIKHQTEKKTNLFKCFLEKDLFAYKGFSFFLYGAFGSVYPYLPLYFKQYGLSSFQVGTIVGIRPLIQIVGAPFWTAIGERCKAERIVLMFGVLAWLIKALLILSVIPHQQLCIEKYTNSTNNITSVYKTDLWRRKECDDVNWIVVREPKIVPKTRIVHADHGKRSNKINSRSPSGSRDEMNRGAGNKQDQSMALTNVYRSRNLKSIDLQSVAFEDTVKSIKSSKTIASTVNRFNPRLNETVSFTTQVDVQEIEYMFWIFLMLIVIGEFLESPTYALSDASLLNRLGEDRGYYGQIRLWGAIGWAISTALVGYLIFKESYFLCALLKPDYNIIFYVYFGFVSCAFVCCYWFSFNGKEENQKSSFKKALKVMSSPNHCIFIMAILFTGCCFGFLFHFVNWYIDDRGGSTVIMGAAGAAREFGEMTFFFLGGVCVRFLGNLNMMAICLISYSACFYWYSVIDSPWLAVPLEALDGSIYGLVWSNSVDYMSTLGAPVGAVAAMQGILQGIFYGLGNGGGTILSGHLYEAIGAQKTFQYFAICALVVLLFLLVFYPIADGCIARQREEDDETEYKPIAMDSRDEDEPINKNEGSAGFVKD